MSLEARHWFLLSSYESPRWHLLSVYGCFVYTEKTLLFSLKMTFLNDLSRQLATSPCTFILWRQQLPLNLINKSLLTSNISFAAPSAPLQHWREIKAILSILWLKRMLWLNYSSRHFTISAIGSFAFFSFMCSSEEYLPFLSRTFSLHLQLG